MRGWLLIGALAIIAIGLWTWRLQAGYGTGFEVDFEGEAQSEDAAPLIDDEERDL